MGGCARKPIPARFCSGIGEFKGEGIEVKAKAKRSVDHLLKTGAVVYAAGSNEKIEIDRVLPVHEGVMYDYRGIIQTEDGLKYIYFNHGAIAEK